MNSPTPKPGTKIVTFSRCQKCGLESLGEHSGECARCGRTFHTTRFLHIREQDRAAVVGGVVRVVAADDPGESRKAERLHDLPEWRVTASHTKGRGVDHSCSDGVYSDPANDLNLFGRFATEADAIEAGRHKLERMVEDRPACGCRRKLRPGSVQWWESVCVTAERLHDPDNGKPHVLKARSALADVVQQLDALQATFPRESHQADSEAIADAIGYLQLAAVCLADVGREDDDGPRFDSKERPLPGDVQ